MPERLILCSGAKRAGGKSILKLALSGQSKNITLKLEDISKKMVRNVPDLRDSQDHRDSQTHKRVESVQDKLWLPMIDHHADR